MNTPAPFTIASLRRARKVAAEFGDIVKVTREGEILLVPNNGESGENNQAGLAWKRKLHLATPPTVGRKRNERLEANRRNPT